MNIKKKNVLFYFLLLSILIIPLLLILTNLSESNGDISSKKPIENFINPQYAISVPFRVGYGNNPAALDPVDTWDIPSRDLQHQVVEGLVEYNYSNHPNYDLIPALAQSWVWENSTRISFTIRENVHFHDGTTLTAEVVKWNFERLMYFCNATGTLPANSTSWEAFPRSLFFFSDGTFIFKSFEVTGLFTFVINLNAPYNTLLDLLCFGAASILSPSSTPRYSYLNLETDLLIGTGPFVYDEYELDKEIRFHAFHDYWRGEAQIKEMIWNIIEDDTARMTAGLAGVFEYIDHVPKSYIDTFKADDDFHVEDVGEDLCYFYLEIYCGPKDTDGTHLDPGNPQYQKNPAYLRRALALMINYSYIWEDIKSGYSVEGTTAVPRAMPGHNASVVQASDEKFELEDNIVAARTLLKEHAADIIARGGIDISEFDVNDDSDWQGKNILGRGLEINRHYGSTTNIKLNQLLDANFDLLGIQTTETVRHWEQYLDTGKNSPWEMDIAYTGWCPYYLNPFYMIDPLFNLASGSCFSRINDTTTGGLTDLMNAAAQETDRDTQLEIYQDIQSYIYDVERPLTPASHTHISCWCDLVQSVYKANFETFHPNVMNILDFYQCTWPPSPVPHYAINTPFRVGHGSNPRALDPVDTWEVPGRDIQHQVVEGLVAYNYSNHPNYDLIPALAQSWVWENSTRISFTIRENVNFHDGTTLTAEVVKWNFERLMYFCNATGTLPANSTSWEAFPRSLFFFSDGTFIFKSFEVTGLFTFAINLNAPFGALLDLLCLGAASILSPSSTPRYSYLNLETDLLVGTGPFVYDRYERDKEIRFHAFHDYWQGEAQIKEMIWTIIEDDTARMTTALTGIFDYVDGIPRSYIDAFEADDDFHVEDVGEYLCYWFLEIYCGPRDTDGTHLDPGNPQYQKNPAYLRRVLALAINYSYIWEDIRSGYSVEGTTAVPRAMPGHNASVVQASDEKFEWEDNIITARTLLKEHAVDIITRGGIDISGFDVNEDSDWQGKNILGRDLELNRHFGSTTNQRLNQLLDANFDLLGIQTTETVRHWEQYLDTGKNSPWEMDIAYIGWCPDYLNPFNMIDPLFNLDSCNCFSRINDTSPGGLTDLVNAASAETNRDIQLEIYRDIQSYIYDVERPLNPASHTHISGWCDLIYQVHKAEIKDFHYNVMKILDFYSLTWAPANFTLTSDDDSPDDDGEFNLIWTNSLGANNYSIFTSSNYITELNGSETVITLLNALSPHSITGLPDGTYYYVVAAHNKLGYTLSNCIKIDVEVTKSLTIISPSISNSWETGTSEEIIWTSTGSISNVKIELYKDSEFVMEIIANTSNDGSYMWVIPSNLEDSTQYQIKISDVTIPDTYDFSENFEIFNPAIRITVPDNYSSWETGTSEEITWTSIGNISDVKIELYKESEFIMEIVASTTNNGSFTWTLPFDLEDEIDYQIKISDVVNPNTYNFSDYFEIFNPVITIITPDNFNSWETRTSEEITWTSRGTILDVKIELYKDGEFVIEIVASMTNDGSYKWAILSDLEDGIDYQIKISDVSNPETYDFSDFFEIFTVVELDSLTITNPGTLSEWEIGTSQYITWISTGTISDVKLELYKDDILILEIAASTPNNGSYIWAIPTNLEDGTDYQIKISDFANPNTYDESPNFILTSVEIPGDGGIPSYNLYILIGLICAVSVILIKKRFNLIK